jgi:hypothetical protein
MLNYSCSMFRKSHMPPTAQIRVKDSYPVTKEVYHDCIRQNYSYSQRSQCYSKNVTMLYVITFGLFSERNFEKQ